MHAGLFETKLLSALPSICLAKEFLWQRCGRPSVLPWQPVQVSWGISPLNHPHRHPASRNQTGCCSIYATSFYAFKLYRDFNELLINASEFSELNRSVGIGSRWSKTTRFADESFLRRLAARGHFLLFNFLFWRFCCNVFRLQSFPLGN